MCDNKRKPHVHAVLICEWAKGAAIEVKLRDGWEETASPQWVVGKEYRIKPEPTDLEKYGVCVGDLWSLEENSESFNFLVTRTVGSGSLTEGIIVGTGSKKRMNIEHFDAILVLRRGEVNKL